ncbi:hypothetical protein R6Q57_006331 [Mikania cordata]
MTMMNHMICPKNLLKLMLQNLLSTTTLRKVQRKDGPEVVGSQRYAYQVKPGVGSFHNRHNQAAQHIQKHHHLNRVLKAEECLMELGVSPWEEEDPCLLLL